MERQYWLLIRELTKDADQLLRAQGLQLQTVDSHPFRLVSL